MSKSLLFQLVLCLRDMVCEQVVTISTCVVFGRHGLKILCSVLTGKT